MYFQVSAIVLALVALAIGAPTENAAVSALSKRVTHSGLGTVYEQENGIGSCGQKNKDSVKIAALSNTFWMKNESPSPFCGRKIKATNVGSDDGVGGKGNTVIVTVEDSCVACDENHVDFSVGAWDVLTNNADLGTINIQWHFCNTDGEC